MNNRPPFQTYPSVPPPNQQQHDWNAYWAQQNQRPQGQLVNPAPTVAAPTPPVQPSPEHAALYANYGYGNQWRPPPQPSQPPQIPPPAQYPPLPPHPPPYGQPPYPVHGYQSLPIMYIQPPQPMSQPQMQQHPMQQQQHQGRPPLPSHIPPQPHQPYYPTAPASINNASQRFPPAKRPRFDNGRQSGPSGPINSGNAAPQFAPQPQPPNTSVPQNHHLPAPPQPMNPGPQQQQPQQQQQQHGRFPPLQPSFKSGGRGPSAPSRGRSGAFSSRGGGTSVRGGISGLSNAGSARGGSTSNRGGASHGAPRGPSFRNNAHSYKASGASQSFTAGISSPSFNPQLPNGQSLSSFPSGSSIRPGRHSHSFTYGREREGTPKREEGSKKTLTDFRIIGVDCPALGWSWGTIVTAPDELSSVPAKPAEASEPEPEPEANSRPVTPTPVADATKTPQEVPTPPAALASSACATESLPKLPTETSRIRLYFNSPVELEEKPAHPHPVDRSRGGKRKKEHDEGEPEESGKRKREDPDPSSIIDSRIAYLSIPPRPIDSTSLSLSGALPAVRPGGDRSADTVHEPTSGIGAKRKAQSLSTDDDVVDSGNTPVSTDAASTTEHEVDTEYVGSPHRPDMLFEEAGPQSMYSFDINEEPASESQAPTEIATDDDAREEIGYGVTSPGTDNSDMKEEELEAAALVSDVPAPSPVNGARESQGTRSEPPAVDSTSNATAPEAPAPVATEAESTPTPAPSQDIDHEPNDSSSSTHTARPVEFPTLALASLHGPKPLLPKIESHFEPPSANRISISYAGSSRRLVLDADIVQTVKIFRSFGRIEVRFVLERFESPLRMIAPPSPEGRGELVNATDSVVPDSKESGSHAHSDTGANTKPHVEGSVPPASVSDGAGDKSTLVESKNEPVAHVSVSDSVPSPDVSADVEAGCVPALDQSDTQSKDVDPKKEGSQRCRGILVEVFSESTKEYVPVTFPTNISDPTLPDFTRLLQDGPTTVDLTAYLDRNKPLSEPKWVRTGDIEDWLTAVFISKPSAGPEGRGAWAGKIEVTDPDPTPTIHTVLENWSTNSTVGVGKDRRRFLKEHMSSSIDNILEILLRLVRGTSSYHSPSAASSLSNITVSSASQLAVTASPNAPHAAQQTHVSLAVLGIYRMAAEYAEKAAEEHGRLEERVGNIVRSLPQHLLYKSLDGIFRDWTAGVGLAVPQLSHMNGARKK